MMTVSPTCGIVSVLQLPAVFHDPLPPTQLTVLSSSRSSRGSSRNARHFSRDRSRLLLATLCRMEKPALLETNRMFSFTMSGISAYASGLENYHILIPKLGHELPFAIQMSEPVRVGSWPLAGRFADPGLQTALDLNGLPLPSLIVQGCRICKTTQFVRIFGGLCTVHLSNKCVSPSRFL